MGDSGRRDTEMRSYLSVCKLCRSCGTVADTGRRDTEIRESDKTSTYVEGVSAGVIVHFVSNFMQYVTLIFLQ